MKIDTNLIPQALKDINSLFIANGVELRAVGGCVRDLVMGNDPKDWDCCTPARPEQVTAILEAGGYKPFDLSNGHGTVSVIADGETYEITTLRRDVETDGRHAEVEFVNDFKLDAERRDFTINAMSLAINTGWVFDYFGGLEDAATLNIRFVGDADKRIQEDYLRILRYFRFAGRFDAATDDLTPIVRNKEGLRTISGERIWMEVKQILTGPNADYVMYHMKQTGVWDVIVDR